jgi:hypothetical protein
MENRLVGRIGIIAAFGFAVSSAFASKPPQTGNADLVTTNITFKLKCDATTCTVNNLSVYIENQGTADAGNSSVQYWLSTDDVLSTDTDALIHTVSTGKIKAGKIKKRTLGGGLLKQAQANSGEYVIVVLDSAAVVDEGASGGEDNNVSAHMIPSSL